ncbi:uncharacterized protein F54H12.2-like [Athalia rosae]|uniref:uncharacterized protein F54H12.2-like n=1 Tax=Athalia rosae TaxID=37344 RepID=UPI002034102A|nr:uncharacterized protein F54H12.2-like [Athalia rosae]
MAYLHAHSCECLKSELDLFTLPPTQTTIEGGQWVHYKPVSSLTDDSPIEFMVPGLSDEYLDLSHTMLSLRVSMPPLDGVQLVSSDGKTPTAAAIAAPVNNLLHSLFSQVDVFFNQKLVSPANNAYAYRAYMETLLNYNNTAKNSHLTTTLWYGDTAGRMDDLGAGNKGFAERERLFKNGSSVDLLGHLHCDVFNQEKFLPNGVELRLRLVRSRDAFCIMETTNAHTMHILEATLLVRRVTINPGVLLAHARALAKGTAKYPLTRVEVKAMTIHGGVHGETLDNVFLGQLPKRIIIGFVDNKAFNGDRTRNPFNFQHFKTNFLSLYVDGQQIPSKPLQPDFTKSRLYVDAYQTLFSGTGIHFLNEGNGISRADYPYGYCLTAFDLTPDLSANSNTHWNLVRHGSVRIEVRFEEALEKTINCVVYAEFDNILEIDSSRQVIVDFGG